MTSDDLAEAIRAHLGLAGITAQVSSTLSTKLTAPGVLIRPDDPWLEPDSFDHLVEHWLVIAFASAGTPDVAERRLAELVDVVIAAMGDGDTWRWSSASAPALDDSTGVSYLAASVSVTTRRPIPGG